MSSPASGRILSLLQEVVTLVEGERRSPSTSTSVNSNNVLPSTPNPPSTPLLTSPTAVLAELRNRFQPYPGAGNQQRFRVAGRSAGRRNLNAVQRTWSNRFFCLGGPSKTKTPNASERLILAENQLGEQVVTADTNSTPEELIINIVQQYPKLSGISFELMRCVGAGGYGKPLVRVSSSNPIPDVAYLKVSRISTIYIRPLLQLISNNDDDNSLELETVNDSTPPNLNIPSSVASSTSISLEDEPGRQDEAGIPTMSSFRIRAAELNPGLQIVRIFRENFFERLFGVYKDPTINLSKELKVEFLGEAGADYGALKREYFWKGFVSLTSEKLDGRALFEGEQDHLIPCTDSKLLRTGVFKFVGKFVAHAAIHCGIGFLGLSEVVAEYLTTNEVTPDTPFTITVADIPDPDHRKVVTDIQKLQSGATLTHEESVDIQELALTCDFVDKVTSANAEEAVVQILYHQVIERRKPYLDLMKLAMKEEGLVEFISQNPFLRPGVFPRVRDVTYPLAVVIDRIQFNGQDSVVEYIKDYLLSLSEDKIPALLKAWTGWSIIPESPLKITVESNVEFHANACFEEISVPEDCTIDDVKTWFDSLIENSEGFGIV